MGQEEDRSEDKEMLWIHLYDMQLTELTPTLQMGFQSLWEVLVVMVVLWRPRTLLSYQSNCGSMLGFPSWTNCCEQTAVHFAASFWLLCFSLLPSYPGIGIYSPNCLALRVSELPFVSLGLCLCQWQMCLLAGSIQSEAVTIAVPCLGVLGQIRNVLGCPSCFPLCCTGFDKLVIG